MTRPGLISCRTSHPRPHRSSVPVPEVLDEHVGGGEQALHRLGALGIGQLQRDRALVAADQRPPQRHAVLLPAELAQVVAGGCSTLITSAPKSPSIVRDHGPGEQRRRVDDADPLERERRARSCGRPLRSRGRPRSASACGRRQVVDRVVDEAAVDAQRGDPSRTRPPRTPRPRVGMRLGLLVGQLRVGAVTPATCGGYTATRPWKPSAARAPRSRPEARRHPRRRGTGRRSAPPSRRPAWHHDPPRAYASSCPPSASGQRRARPRSRRAPKIAVTSRGPAPAARISSQRRFPAASRGSPAARIAARLHAGRPLGRGQRAGRPRRASRRPRPSGP